MPVPINQISGIEQPQISLNAVTGVVNGAIIQFNRVRKNVSMVVVLTGAPTGCKVVLRASADGVLFSNPLETFDVTAGNSSSDLISVSGLAAVAARADLQTLSGGTSPTVTVTILAE